MTAGDVVIAAFPGAERRKIRPAVVLSSEVYHQHRPDVILGLLTTRTGFPLAPTDYEILEWQAAGLHSPSTFRLYLVTLLRQEVRVIGRLHDADWQAVQARVRSGVACN